MITPPPISKPQRPSMARPQPGVGGEIISYEGLGFSVSAQTGGTRFGHPWKPFLGGSRLQFTLGLVTSKAVLVPVIKVGGRAVRLDHEPAPQLVLAPGVANEAGESYAVLEVVPNAAGELTDQSRVEIVHARDGGRSLDPLLGRKPIALILWRGHVPTRVFPLVHFHLEYQRVLPAAGHGAVRHLFL